MNFPIGTISLQKSDKFLYICVVIGWFMGIKINIKEFLEDGKSNKRIDLVLGSKLTKLLIYFFEYQHISIIINFGGHHISLFPFGLIQKLLLLLSAFCIFVEESRNV